MSLKEQYENLCKKWTPEVGDNPDNFWFYSAWYAVKVILACNGIEANKLNAQIHQALCQSQGDWDLFLECLERNLPAFPPEPRRGYCSDHEPDTDLSRRARELFEHSFRARFKGQRLNSKFGAKKWEEVRDKAFEIAKEEYLADQARWNVREESRAKAYSALHENWQEDYAKVNEIRRAIEVLSGKEVPCSPASKSSA